MIVGGVLGLFLGITLFLESATADLVPAEIYGLLWPAFWIAVFVFLLLAPVYAYYLYHRLRTGDQTGTVSFAACEIITALDTSPNFFVAAQKSTFLKKVLDRVNLAPDTLKPVKCHGNVPLISYFSNQKEPVDLPAVASFLIEHFPDLPETLLTCGVTEDSFQKAAWWVQADDTNRITDTRFWSKAAIDKIEPIGRTFSYGRAYTLEKLTTDYKERPLFSKASQTNQRDDLQNIWRILSRPESANALLVGDEATGLGDTLQALTNSLRNNTCPDYFRDHELRILDTTALITATENKAALDRLLSKLVAEVAEAGSIILVIEDYPEFVSSASGLGVNIPDILQPAFSASAVPLILTSSPAAYHNQIENTTQASQFGVVTVDKDTRNLFPKLAELARKKEGSNTFEVSAIEAIIDAGRRSALRDKMPLAAVNIIEEMAAGFSDTTITEQLVNEYITEKTGVPTGRPTDRERHVLNNLEDILAERVVGQDKALQAVASALRRNRAGTENQRKPIGSFLFLGPTGVGKTQTAKTLSNVYFSGQDMARLDMSEYSGTDALASLRGQGGSPGRLATLVREKSYGVLLLDEFEKAASAVHDLFLQIFDEGYFTDGLGNRVNFENELIIATSNAGAKNIFRMAENERDFSHQKDAFLDNLITDGLFRPELLNRFDATVLFAPLDRNARKQVTQILLNELADRMKKKAIEVEFSSGLVDKLADYDNPQKFGARAIKREIQDTVEDTLAEKMLNSQLKPGDHITLTAEDVYARA
jgi:ATP-dependent Clp protease ATP-binding subunit ClpC